MASKKKLFTVLSLVGITGFALFMGISTYVQKQKKAEAAAKLQNQNSTLPQKHLLNIQAHDIAVVQMQPFTQKIAISGIFKPTQEVNIKAKNYGDITGFKVKSGDYVKAGQVIAKIINIDFQSRLQQSNSQINVAKEQLDLATIQYNKQFALMKEGVISKNALDSYKSSLDIAKANVKAAQAAQQISGKSVSDMMVIAPFSGIVATTYIQNNEKVNIDTPILHLVNTQTLELEAGINANDIQKVNIGQQVHINIENNVENVTNSHIVGKVVRIAPISNGSARLVNAYIKVDNNNQNNMIKAGVFAKADIVIHAQDMPAVDESSIQRLPNGQSFVYALKNKALSKINITESMYKDKQKVGVENLEIGTSVVNIPLSLDKPAEDIIINIVH